MAGTCRQTNLIKNQAEARTINRIKPINVSKPCRLFISSEIFLTDYLFLIVTEIILLSICMAIEVLNHCFICITTTRTVMVEPFNFNN